MVSSFKRIFAVSVTLNTHSNTCYLSNYGGGGVVGLGFKEKWEQTPIIHVLNVM